MDVFKGRVWDVCKIESGGLIRRKRGTPVEDKVGDVSRR